MHLFNQTGRIVRIDARVSSESSCNLHAKILNSEILPKKTYLQSFKSIEPGKNASDGNATIENPEGN